MSRSIFDRDYIEVSEKLSVRDIFELLNYRDVLEIEISQCFDQNKLLQLRDQLDKLEERIARIDEENEVDLTATIPFLINK